jgi:hypothetical protein
VRSVGTGLCLEEEDHGVERRAQLAVVSEIEGSVEVDGTSEKLAV